MFKCFQENEEALEKLIIYYQELGEFEKGKMTKDQISKFYYVPSNKEKNRFLTYFFKLFKRNE